jgi:hypothetical protein
MGQTEAPARGESRRSTVNPRPNATAPASYSADAQAAEQDARDGLAGVQGACPIVLQAASPALARMLRDDIVATSVLVVAYFRAIHATFNSWIDTPSYTRKLVTA